MSRGTEVMDSRQSWWNPVPEEISGTHVILAEDEPDISQMLADALRAEGYAVTEFTDGRCVLEYLIVRTILAKNENLSVPQLVISDVAMPGCTGLELLQGIRDEDWDIPVLLMSGFGDRETHLASQRLGALLLDKPFGLDRFVDMVHCIVPPQPGATDRAGRGTPASKK